MAKSKQELMAIRDESYRVQRVEMCSTCQHWRPLRSDHGLCLVVSTGDSPLMKLAHLTGKCDLWEGRSNGQNQ